MTEADVVSPCPTLAKVIPTANLETSYKRNKFLEGILEYSA